MVWGTTRHLLLKHIQCEGIAFEDEYYSRCATKQLEDAFKQLKEQESFIAPIFLREGVACETATFSSVFRIVPCLNLSNELSRIRERPGYIGSRFCQFERAPPCGTISLHVPQDGKPLQTKLLTIGQSNARKRVQFRDDRGGVSGGRLRLHLKWPQSYFCRRLEGGGRGRRGFLMK